MSPSEPPVPEQAPLSSAPKSFPRHPVTAIVPLDEVSDAVRGGAISIGNFDGVHLGHAALLAHTRHLADRIGGPAVAVVLDPHPAAILRPEKTPPKLSWIQRRAELMAPIGIDYLVVCPTSADFLRLSAETFFDLLIRTQLAAKGVVEGPNFYFGHQRGGNVELLRALCDQHTIEMLIVSPTHRPSSADGLQGNNRTSQMISSTRIRRLLAGSRIGEATELLGHPHRIRGRVVSGDQRGRKIGFPTANLAAIDVLVPGPGVYGGVAWVDGEAFRAAVHVGPRPTFTTADQRRVEVHLLDFCGDLYGQMLQVDVVSRVRDIARFESATELADQLARDVQTIRDSGRS